MKKIAIDIEVSCGGRREMATVAAWLVAPGIAVHEGWIVSRLWTVTHVPTGHSLFGELPTKRESVAVAEQFAALGNWDRERKDIPKSLLKRGGALKKRLSKKGAKA